METAQAVRDQARRIAAKRRPVARRAHAGMGQDDRATFDPIYEPGLIASPAQRLWPTSPMASMAAGRFGYIGRHASLPLGSMADEPELDTPERFLMIAVLHGAVKERDTVWANRKDHSHLYSIENVCNILGLSIDRVRRACNEGLLTRK